MENEEQKEQLPYKMVDGIKVWRDKQDMRGIGNDYENTFRTLPPDSPDEQSGSDPGRRSAPEPQTPNQ